MLYLLDAQLKMYTILVSRDFPSTKWLIIHIAESVAFSSNKIISQFQMFVDFSSTWKSSIFNASDQFHSSVDFKDDVFPFLFRLKRILFQNYSFRQRFFVNLFYHQNCEQFKFRWKKCYGLESSSRQLDCTQIKKSNAISPFHFQRNRIFIHVWMSSI